MGTLYNFPLNLIKPRATILHETGVTSQHVHFNASKTVWHSTCLNETVIILGVQDATQPMITYEHSRASTFF